MADIKADVPNAHILCNLMMKYGVCFVPQRCHCISDQWHYIRHSVSHWRGVNYKEKNPWDRAWCPHIEVSRAHRPYSCPPFRTRLGWVKMENLVKKAGAITISSLIWKAIRNNMAALPATTGMLRSSWEWNSPYNFGCIVYSVYIGWI